MSEFGINLIRDRIPAARQRRLRFVLVAAYLLFAAVALVLTVSQTTAKVVSALNTRDELARLEARFRSWHNTPLGVVPYASGIETELIRRRDSLKAVEQALAGRTCLAPILYQLAAELPPSVSLQSVELNAAEHGFTFDLAMLADRPATRDLAAASLISQWQQDPQFAAELGPITFLGSHRQMNEGKASLIWRFSARLAK